MSEPSAISCPSCGKTTGRRRFCRYCGAELARSDGARPAPDLAAPHEVPSLPAWFSERPAPVPPEEAFVQLGIALAARERHAEALAAFERALLEGGTDATRRNAAAGVIRQAEILGDAAAALRGLFEATLLDPESLAIFIEHARPWAAPTAIRSLEQWIREASARRLDDASSDGVRRALADLLHGRILLFLGDASEALERIRRAADQAPHEMAGWAAQLFRRESLPPALAEARDGPSHFLLAQVQLVLRNFDSALVEVNKALELGLGTGTAPDAPALKLKAEALRALESGAEAAESFFQAGYKFGWRAEYPEAVGCLAEAARLRPERGPTYWLWAELLRCRAWQLRGEPRQRALREALEIWEKGIGRATPDAEYAWVWRSYALMRQVQAEWLTSRPEDKTGLVWDAVTALESGLLLSPDDVDNWINLGYCYRRLNLHASALAATEAALAIDATNGTALEERCAALCDLERFDDARAIFAKLPQDARSPLARSLDAFIRLASGEPDAAEKVLRALVQEDPEDLWNREFLARSLYHQGRDAEAEQECRALVNQGPPDLQPSSSRAFAHFHLGEYARAAELLEWLARDRTRSPGSDRMFLGLCRIRGGDLEQGRRDLLEGIDACTTSYELTLHVDLEFPLFLRVAAPAGSPAERLIEEARGLAEAARARLREGRPTHASELQRVGSEPAADGAIGAARVAVQAGLARIHAQRGEWPEAAAIYEKLGREPRPFPQARCGLVDALRGTLERAGELIRAGNPRDALSGWLDRISPQVLLGSEDAALFAAHVAHRAMARFTQDHSPTALPELAEAVRTMQSAGDERPGLWLGELCARLLATPASYWALLDLLGSGPSSPGATTMAPHVSDARITLARFLDEYYGLVPDEEAFVPVAAPILVDIDVSLAPPDAEQGWPLLKVEIPEMRKRLLDRMGVAVPPIRIRGKDDLPTRAYVLLLEEVQIASGEVRPGMRYCPLPAPELAAMGVAPRGLVDAPFPVDQRPGCWVPAISAEALCQHGVEVWAEPLTFALRHLEELLGDRLAMFVGIDEVRRWKEEWAKEAGAAGLVAALEGDDACLAFARLLRSLLDERVAIVDWREILLAFREAGGASGDPLEVLRAARLRLRPRLPAIDAGSHRIEVSPELEEKLARGLVRSRHGGTSFALPQLAAKEIVDEIRKEIARGARALVVRDPAVRPFARRVADVASHGLAVLSAEEVTGRSEEGLALGQASAGSPR